MGPIDCPETSVRNYLYSLRHSPEERSSYLIRGKSLKSRKSGLRFYNKFICHVLFVCLFVLGATAPSGPGPPTSRVF